MFGLFRRRRDITIPRPPEVGVYAVVMRARAMSMIRDDMGCEIMGYPHDPTYAMLSTDSVGWVGDWLRRVRRHLRARGYGYQLHDRDCDDMAMLAIALRQLLRTERAAPLAVRLTVRLQDGNYHMTTAWSSDRGWQILEPQTGERTPLADYPHKILGAFF